MPSVNEITQRLIDIVQANTDLQDVWLQGKISKIKPIRNGPFNFTLTDGSERIDCVIFDNGISLQTDLPSEGSGVYVKGQIFIYGVSSEYKFKVTNIKLSENSSPNQSVSVSTLTEVLENTIADHSGEAQGQIADIYEADTGWANFQLKDVTADKQFNDVIECSLPPSTANALPFPLREGEKISVRGKFKIFPARSAYQIVIYNSADMEQVSGTQAEALNAQVEHEEIVVVDAVLSYFEAPQFANFSTERECKIQFGNKYGLADVVLRNSKNELSAIAECKRIGYDGNSGIPQLQSYLAASGTTLGLFAADTDPYEWIFLRNLGKGKFIQITRAEFEAIARDKKIRPSHETLNRNPTLQPVLSHSTSRIWQFFVGALGVALCICLTVLIMQLDEKNRQIQQYTHKNSKLEGENKKLQEQITEKDKQIQNSPQIISQLQNENKTLEGENRKLQEQITEKDKQIQSNTSTVLKLETENKTLVSENQLLQTQITENKKEIQSLVTKNKELERKIEEWESLRNGSPTPKPMPPDNPPILLNINTASIEKLQTLPGIGPAKAQSIFNYREKHGKFDSVEDITKVSGIGEKTLENLRKFISAE